VRFKKAQIRRPDLDRDLKREKGGEKRLIFGSDKMLED